MKPLLAVLAVMLADRLPAQIVFPDLDRVNRQLERQFAEIAKQVEQVQREAERVARLAGQLGRRRLDDTVEKMPAIKAPVPGVEVVVRRPGGITGSRRRRLAPGSETAATASVSVVQPSASREARRGEVGGSLAITVLSSPDELSDTTSPQSQEESAGRAASLLNVSPTATETASAAPVGKPPASEPVPGVDSAVSVSLPNATRGLADGAPVSDEPGPGTTKQNDVAKQRSDAAKEFYWSRLRAQPPPSAAPISRPPAGPGK